MSSRFTLVNSFILLLVLAVISLSIYVYVSEKELNRLEIETGKQNQKVEILNEKLTRSQKLQDSLQAALDSTEINRIRYEEILDSIRNAPNPNIDRIRTAKPSELERYFIDRYK